MVTPNTRPKTQETFEAFVTNHLKPGLGSIRLKKLTPLHIQRFLNMKAEGGLSPKTVKHLRDTLRNALNVAVKWDLLPSNPATKVDPPRIEKNEPRTFAVEEARAFLDAARHHRWEALFSVALAVGLRRGEALGLGWDDIDFAAGTLQVRYQIQRIKGSLVRGPVKTKKSRRVIVLPPFALAALEEHREKQEVEREFAGDLWEESGLVFTTRLGTAIDPRNLLSNFYRLIVKAKVPKIRFHDLRHSAASLLMAKGVHPKAVQELLGHSDVSITLNTYSHVYQELRKEAADQMQNMLKPEH